MERAIRQLLEDYPPVFFACHTRHARDPQSKAQLTDHQASILDHLSAERPIRLTMLAKHMAVTPATMSVAVARLVDRGYLRRRRDPVDARAVGLMLTAKGLRMQRSKSVLDPERVRAVLGRLTPGDRRRALIGLKQLADAARAELAAFWRKRATEELRRVKAR